MHTLIYALVRVDKDAQYPEDEALGSAKTIFDGLVGIGEYAEPVFDYYTTFDDHSSSVSGPNRYGEKQSAVPITEPEGARMLHYGWKGTRLDFERSLSDVKELLEKLDDDEIMEDKEFIRNKFYRLGQYRGSEIRLYSDVHGGIRRRSTLDRALEDTEDLWIVPADVHF